MDIALRTQKGLKVDPAIFQKFVSDFNTTVEQEIKKSPDAWIDVSMTIGTLSDEIRSANQDQYIAVPITDIDGKDGGYIHVYGYSTVNDLSGLEEEIDEVFNAVLRQVRTVTKILFMSEYVQDEDKIMSHIKQYYRMAPDLDDVYDDAINDAIVFYRQLLKNQL